MVNWNDPFENMMAHLSEYFSPYKGILNFEGQCTLWRDSGPLQPVSLWLVEREVEILVILVFHTGLHPICQTDGELDETLKPCGVIVGGIHCSRARVGCCVEHGTVRKGLSQSSLGEWLITDWVFVVTRSLWTAGSAGEQPCRDCLGKSK